jgi:hypothetical protein
METSINNIINTINANLHNVLVSYKLCSKCNLCKPNDNFKPKRKECNTCLLERKRQYYRDNLMKFKEYYQINKQPKKLSCNVKDCDKTICNE